MKKKDFEKKLQVKKETISHLSEKEMKGLYAGTGPRTLMPGICHNNVEAYQQAAN